MSWGAYADDNLSSFNLSIISLTNFLTAGKYYYVFLLILKDGFRRLSKKCIKIFIYKNVRELNNLSSKQVQSCRSVLCVFIFCRFYDEASSVLNFFFIIETIFNVFYYFSTFLT